MEEKKKNKKRRALLLLLLLAITGIMLSTTTYAWFTANTSVKVNTITVNVEARNGIQLSANAVDWRTIIQTTDITGAHNAYAETAEGEDPIPRTFSVNQLPDILEPVSTDGTVNDDGRLEMFFGTTSTNTNGDYILTAEQLTDVRGTEGKYVAFDLFFRVDVKDDLNTTEIVETTTPFYLTTNSKVTTPDVTDTGIKNATRVAFVVLGHTAVGTDIADVQTINGGATSPEYIWEPNYDVHTPAGVNAALTTYGITTTLAGGTQLPYEGVTAAITADNNVLLTEANSNEPVGNTNDAFFNPVTIAYATTAANTNYVRLFDLENGITKVRVYMWIEGQDVDCENSASGGNINYDLQFSIVSQ